MLGPCQLEKGTGLIRGGNCWWTPAGFPCVCDLPGMDVVELRAGWDGVGRGEGLISCGREGVGNFFFFF